MSDLQMFRQLMAQHRFTQDLTTAQQEILAGYARLVNYPANGYLIRQDRLADDFFMILSGLVAIEVSAPGESVVRLLTLGAGEVAGWSWAVPPYRAVFNARALEETSGLALRGRDLRKLFHGDPALGYAFMVRLMSLVGGRVTATLQRLSSGAVVLREEPGRE